MCTETPLLRFGLTDEERKQQPFKLSMRVVISDYTKVSEPQTRPETELLQYGIERRAITGEIFKKKRYILAYERYKKLVDLYRYVEDKRYGHMLAVPGPLLEAYQA